jgi:hypothetical protein
MANNTSTSFEDGYPGEPSTLGDKLADGATRLQDKTAEIGRRATGAVDQNIASAATGLDRAAASLHGRAENLPGVDKLSGLAHATADKLSTTADFLREHDVAKLKDDLKTLVKRNPGSSLLIAGVIGFLVGRTIFSSRN